MFCIDFNKFWAKKAAISDQTLNILPQNSSDPNIFPLPPGMQKRELYPPLEMTSAVDVINTNKFKVPKLVNAVDNVKASVSKDISSSKNLDMPELFSIVDRLKAVKSCLTRKILK